MSIAGVTAIQTDWGNDPRIIRMTTPDTFLQITGLNYLKNATVLKTIGAIQNTQDGTFQWNADDVVLINYADGEGFFNVDSTVDFTFYPLAGNRQTLLSVAVPVSLTAFLANYTTPVPIITAVPGYIIQVDSWALQLIYGTVAVAGAGALTLQYNATDHGAGIAASNAITAADFFATANSYEYSAGGLCPIEPWTSVENVGIYLSNTTGSQTGGTGSSFIVNVWYRLVVPGVATLS